MAGEFPEIYDVINQGEFLDMSVSEIESSVIRLYRQHVEEVDGLLRKIETTHPTNVERIGVRPTRVAASEAS